MSILRSYTSVKKSELLEGGEVRPGWLEGIKEGGDDVIPCY